MRLLLIISGLIAYCASNSEAAEVHSLALVPLYDEESVKSAGERNSFKCPFPFGSFSDPDDCNKYYVCVMNKATHRSCRRSQNFDTLRRTCVARIVAVCGNNKDKSSTTTSATKTTSGMFICFSWSGLYPNPNDCSKYWKCSLFIPSSQTCPSGQLFDAVKSSCESATTVNCGDRPRPGQSTTQSMTKSTSGISVTTQSTTKITTGMFFCPSWSGQYSHPDDCSKYYKCSFFIASVKTCPQGQLFDAVKSSCESASSVNCGDRPRPGASTTVDELTSFSLSTSDDGTSVKPSTTVDDISVSLSTTDDESGVSLSTTDGETSVSLSTTVDDISASTSTIDDDLGATTGSPATTDDQQTATPTDPPLTITDSPTATEEDKRPTGPPETDCPEGDDDCLIDEMGDPSDWFKCPAAFGSHPHPSSERLFIFCMNWLPSVKKCGLNRVYSKEKSTCV